MPRLSLVGVILWLSIGVMLPVLLSTAVGIITLALGDDTNYIVVSVLIISFTATALGCGLTATVLIGRRQRLARQQSDLASNVSHEIRTPLATIQMYTQLLLLGKMDDQPAERRAAYQAILREVRWLDATVDVLLAWRAAERDLDALDRKEAPIDDTVRLGVKRFRQMVNEDHLDLELEGASDATVNHDRGAIVSALTNLLSNAYKYSNSDRRLRVSLARRDAGVAIIVADNGLGIRASDLRRIYDPFFRADARDSGKASGIGLGLTIVRRIVAGHGGHIEVESTPGEGSCFTVILPAVSTVTPRAEAPADG